MKKYWFFAVVLSLILAALTACNTATSVTSRTNPATATTTVSTPITTVTKSSTISSAASSPAPSSTAAAKPVPPEFTGLYSNLKTALDGFNTVLDSRSSTLVHPVTFGAELLAANGNRGEELLKPGVIDSVKLTLDRFQEMGIQGVTFPIGYPLYIEEDPNHAGYVNFFKQVVQEIRKRGMKLDIESAVVFANTPFSPITTSFAGLTFDQFKAGKAKMVANIINDLHPDYLDLGCEPDTMAQLTGLKEFNDPAKYIDYVNYVFANVNRGSTKMIAGIGTWDDISYVRDLLAQTGIDCVAIHIYPVIGDGLMKAISVISLAFQYNKRAVLDECWLYKTDTSATGGVAAAPDIYRLDSYSFFTPLDEEFFSEIVRLARAGGIEYISPFWSTFFFGNVDYSAANANLSYVQTAALANAAASLAMRTNKLTPLGDYYKQLIAENR
jgi:hypothetical protein